MSQTAIEVLIGLGTYALSVVTTVFIMGMKYGEMKSDMKSMREDLSEIKGMFVLKLRDDNGPAK